VPVHPSRCTLHVFDSAARVCVRTRRQHALQRGGAPRVRMCYALDLVGQNFRPHASHGSARQDRGSHLQIVVHAAQPAHRRSHTITICPCQARPWRSPCQRRSRCCDPFGPPLHIALAPQPLDARAVHATPRLAREAERVRPLECLRIAVEHVSDDFGGGKTGSRVGGCDARRASAATCRSNSSGSTL
jgi:hypothetical protein